MIDNNLMFDNKLIFASEVVEVENKILGTDHVFAEDDILAIDLWEPKANYQTPLFITKTGHYTVPTTMAECIHGLPTFANLDNCLVNIPMVEQVNPLWSNINKPKINSKRHPLLSTISANKQVLIGGTVSFKHQPITTSINLTSLEHWDAIKLSALTAPVENLHILGSLLLPGKKVQTGASSLVPINEILYIEMWEPKRNYYVPKFYTSSGANYTVGLTFTSVKDSFPYLFPVSRSVLVNIDQINDIHRDPEDKKLYIYFKYNNYRTSITENKYKLLNKLL